VPINTCDIQRLADRDRFVEKKCRRVYASVMGRPSLAPGRDFRLLVLGYFEGIDSERGILTRFAQTSGIETPRREAERAVDLGTGAIVAVTLQGADEGDTTTIVDTVTAAVEQVEAG
jgi:hypothetical protein